MIEVMRDMPELDVRWRRFSISAKGREAIDAIRTPFFISLVANAIAAVLVVASLALRPDWLSVKQLVTAWMR